MEDIMINTLLDFFQSYLSLEPDFFVALGNFYNSEDEKALRNLESDINSLLASDIDDAQLRKLFEDEANYYINRQTDPKKFLIEILELIPKLLLTNTKKKVYDIFISYSSKDKSVAERLAYELKEKGYNIWLDKWEILVGQNIVDEVYKAIRLSKYMIVVLSKSSSQSKWVREELTTGKLQEIEQQRVKVLPVIIEKCRIPTPLETKRYADLTNWHDGVKNLLASLQGYESEKKLKGEYQIIETKQYSFTKLESFYTEEKKIILSHKWRDNEAYKDVVFGPPDDVNISIEKTKLLKAIKACRIRLKRWGGAPFPYEDSYPAVKKIPFKNGIRIVDKQTWPFSDWSFNYWAIIDKLFFLQRTDFKEDHNLDEYDNSYTKGTIFLDWILKDICTPLMFTYRMIGYLKLDYPLKVNFNWSGMRGRKLLLAFKPLVPDLEQFPCGVDEMQLEYVVKINSNLLEGSYKLVKDAFWYFGYDRYSPEQLEDHLLMLLKGIYP